MSIAESANISDSLDHLYRHEYGKLVSVLTRAFGTSNIQLAEDVVHDAMHDALKTWAFSGVPENPVGWIYAVARNKAANILKREKHKRDYAVTAIDQSESNFFLESSMDLIFTDDEIADDQLRMIFTCCHPSISSDSQVALTLKTLCGLSIPEIANAFLTTEENINKRLVRARKAIRVANIPFEVPTGRALESRMVGVLEVIYLLFNEGYNSSVGDELIRAELCQEAVRLAEIIVQNPNVNSSNTFALMALMLLNGARFSSRVDEFNNIIDLSNQDRGKWDREMIQKGLQYLEYATAQNEVSLYHILATISAHHCTAASYESTDWEGILSLYDMLRELDTSPIVLLNRAVVLSKTGGVEVALKQLEAIEGDPVIKSYLPFYITRAELYYQNSKFDDAKKSLRQALALTDDSRRIDLINSRLADCSEES